MGRGSERLEGGKGISMDGHSDYNMLYTCIELSKSRKR